MRRIPSCLLAACLATAADDALARLPAPPREVPVATAQAPFDPLAGTLLAPGVRVVAGARVVLDGIIAHDSGPVDGLEVLACLNQSVKTQETLIRLQTGSGAVVKAAVLAAFGLPDGRPADEAGGIPARGAPMRLTVLWRNEDGAWLHADAATLVRDRCTDRAFPPLPWVHTGSRVVPITMQAADGTRFRRDRFMLDQTQSIAVNYDEPDALFASPFPCADQDERFEANSAVVPPAKTPVHLVISAAEVVLPLRLEPSGQLSQEGRDLDDDALAGAIATAFAGTTRPPHRAITVRTAGGTADEAVVAARGRLLAVAARARAWCVPVFQPDQP